MTTSRAPTEIMQYKAFLEPARLQYETSPNLVVRASLRIVVQRLTPVAMVSPSSWDPLAALLRRPNPADPTAMPANRRAACWKSLAWKNPTSHPPLSPRNLCPRNRNYSISVEIPPVMASQQTLDRTPKLQRRPRRPARSMVREQDYPRFQKTPPAMLRPRDILLDQQRPKLLVGCLESVRTPRCMALLQTLVYFRRLPRNSHVEFSAPVPEHLKHTTRRVDTSLHQHLTITLTHLAMTREQDIRQPTIPA